MREKILTGFRVNQAVTEANRAVRESFDLGVLLRASVPSSIGEVMGIKASGEVEGERLRRGF